MSGGHGHGAPNAGAAHRWRLRAAFALIAAFFVVELVSAAGQRLAVAAQRRRPHGRRRRGARGRPGRDPHRGRPDTTGRRTFGSYRAEVFASGLAVLLMLGVAVYIVVEADRAHRRRARGRLGRDARRRQPRAGRQPRRAGPAARRRGESLNVKGAYLEVVADTVGSVGVIAAALLVAATGSVGVGHRHRPRHRGLRRGARRRCSGARSSPCSASTPRPGIEPAEAERPCEGSAPSSRCTTCTCGP